MKPMTIFPELYRGDGATLQERNLEMPVFEPLTGLDDPRNYLADPGLRDAMNVALALGQPLLVTGEPGTGKTRLADSIAWELGLECLRFHTKTTATAADLFYHYDALRRFQDAHLKDQTERPPVEAYITCQALGTAILRGMRDPGEKGRRILPDEYRNQTGPVRSVVLIDEIDKAPRDLPNDVLNEVETMQFRIRETDWPPFQADPEYRPILLMTSNSEKNLPDAFLRRCVFYHIPFPDEQTLAEIVRRRFGEAAFSHAFLKAALRHFMNIRKLGMRKPPATAEFLAWISILKALKIDLDRPDEVERNRLNLSYSVLAKTREDLALLKRKLPEPG